MTKVIVMSSQRHYVENIEAALRLLPRLRGEINEPHYYEDCAGTCAGVPEATRVFEKLGIDYCCGGNKSLEEACAAANLSVDEVLDSLELAEETSRAKQKERNWQIEPLADVIDHIKSTHHKYTREEIARLGPLFDKVCSVHGKNHPELQHVRASFRGVAQELTTHMMKEEMVLFPYIVQDGRVGHPEGTSSASTFR